MIWTVTNKIHIFKIPTHKNSPLIPVHKNAILVHTPRWLCDHSTWPEHFSYAVVVCIQLCS